MDIQQPGKGDMVEDQAKWEKTQEVTSCQRTGSHLFMCVKVIWDAYFKCKLPGYIPKPIFLDCLPAGLLYKRGKTI